jgi:Domain of unknown function (DUF4124)
MKQRAWAAVSVASAFTLIWLCQQAWAQPIYKWVDENGVVHYGESVPPGVENFEQLDTAPLPVAPSSAPRQPPALVQPAPSNARPARPAATPAPPAAAAGQPSDMSLAELDQRCEEAREAAIAPLRVAAIAECKANPRTDPAYCERFYATFGDAVGIRPGVVRPRMFDDLPACEVAREEHRRRSQ